MSLSNYIFFCIFLQLNIIIFLQEMRMKQRWPFSQIRETTKLIIKNEIPDHQHLYVASGFFFGQYMLLLLNATTPIYLQLGSAQGGVNNKES